MKTLVELKDSAKNHISGLKRAANVTKKRTQGIVEDFLSMNAMGSVGEIPYFATRVCQVTTANDSKAFKLFIEHHFPLSWNSEKKMFNKKPISNKQRKAECEEARKVFIEEYDGNYWLWVTAHVKVEKKEVDWYARVDSAFNGALNKGELTMDDILRHVIEKQGLTLDTFLHLLAPEQLIEGELAEEAQPELDKAA